MYLHAYPKDCHSTIEPLNECVCICSFTAGLDYQGLVETIAITPVATQYCTNLSVSQDAIVEPSEFFTITLSTTADVIRFTDAQNITVTIEDTDGKRIRSPILVIR